MVSLIEQIKADREKGRGNQWRLIETLSSATVMDGTCEVLSYCELEGVANRANARRIARVPILEQRLLDAVSALEYLSDEAKFDNLVTGYARAALEQLGDAQ